MTTLTALQTPIGLVHPTAAVKMAVDMVNSIRRQPTDRIGQICGDPGTGKTSISHYLSQHLVAVRLRGLDTSKRDHLYRLSVLLGYVGPSNSTYATLLSYLESRVDKDTIVLLDEADNITWRHLEPFRYLSDERGVTVVIFGTDILTKNFSDARSGAYLARLSSRIGTKLIHIRPLSKEGIEKYILLPEKIGLTNNDKGETKVDKAILRKWEHYTKGNWRLCYDLVHAYRDCEASRAEGLPNAKDATDLQLIDIAAATLHGRSST